MTDVHFYRAPRLRGVVGKRALGLANLHVAGRVRYFDATEVVAGAVDDALGFRPDAFLMTGDVTAMSSEEEFVAARRAFAPLLESVPSIVIPGNHDLYTRGARREARMERHFGEFMAGGTWDEEAGCWGGSAALEPGKPVPWPVRFRLGSTDFVATNPCRPTLRSSGLYPAGAIERAEELVRESSAAGQQVVYLLQLGL